MNGHRHIVARTVLLSLATAFCMPLTTQAQDAPVTFELRPHCDSSEFQAAFGVTPAAGVRGIADSTCPAFSVKDPQTQQTDILQSGDPLDMDLIIHNPSGKPIERFRTWLAFDSTAIEGELLEISKSFPTPTPGETSFSAGDGYIKISGTADKTQTATTIIVAHIRLHTLPNTLSSTPITFYDASGTATSHTGVFTKESTTETNLITKVLGSLLVRLTPTVASSAASTPAANTSAQATSSLSSSLSSADSSTSTNNQLSSTPSPAPSPSVFNLLQVQHLRVTTEGSSVFLAWDVLPSTDIVGYNLYYGTVSGQYIQKRSVDKNSTTITIRALTVGTTYYFSVRGVNAKNQETDFSQEQGISVGNPKTSTAPLTASAIDHVTKTPKTGGTVSGTTGTSSTLMLFLALSAVVGTGLAFRRQLTADSRL